jgi:hypothetical protein
MILLFSHFHFCRFIFPAGAPLPSCILLHQYIWLYILNDLCLLAYLSDHRCPAKQIHKQLPCLPILYLCRSLLYFQCLLPLSFLIVLRVLITIRTATRLIIFLFLLIHFTLSSPDTFNLLRISLFLLILTILAELTVSLKRRFFLIILFCDQWMDW